MGLDMYLKKREKLSADNKTNDAIRNFISWISVKGFYEYPFEKWTGDPETVNRLPDIKSLVNLLGHFTHQDIEPETEMAYWRKANAIHGWFVKNIQDGIDDCCMHRPLTKEDLQNLKDTCQRVMQDHSLAEKLLPVTPGFFFGGYEYDDIYFDKLEYTISVLDRLIQTFDFEHYYLYYESSW